jgi:putative spermidine/putrescine transport system ATP-binding protein
VKQVKQTRAAIRGETFEELRLEGVSRDFGSHHALRELDLTIRGGEFVALLGPSGCGKTTALNCLAGLLPLTSGTITMDERRVDILPPEQRGFGMVFQNYALFPHMSVRANIGFGLRMRKVSKGDAKRRVDEAIKLVQLEKFAERLPGQLSGGQQQRVAIARAIVFEPPLVLMDEPLSNLDAKLRLDMRTEIRRIHQSVGLTTVYVTHDQEEALSLADRLVVLRDGRVMQVGTPEDLYMQPANRYVAGFMGYRNMLELKVTEGSGKFIKVADDTITLFGTGREELTSADAVAAFRPEDVLVGDTGENRIDATVEVVEFHGREQAVQARLADGQALTLRTDKRLAPGDRVALSIPKERVLVFSADTPAAPDEVV